MNKQRDKKKYGTQDINFFNVDTKITIKTFNMID